MTPARGMPLLPSVCEDCGSDSVGIMLSERVLQHGSNPVLLVDRKGEGRIVTEASRIHRLVDRCGEAAVAVPPEERRDLEPDEAWPGDRVAVGIETHDYLRGWRRSAQSVSAKLILLAPASEAACWDQAVPEITRSSAPASYRSSRRHRQAPPTTSVTPAAAKTGKRPGA